jgi:GNAT superfamily N-acetyltransferase
MSAVRRVLVADLDEVRRLRYGFLDEALSPLRPEAVATWRQYDSLWWVGFIDRGATSDDEYLVVAPAPDELSLVAIAHAARATSTISLGMLYVDPAYRGHGIARALLDARTNWALHSGALTMECWIGDQNAVSATLHEHDGWIRTDVTRATVPPASESLWTCSLI